jgi:hypothetical protein
LSGGDTGFEPDLVSEAFQALDLVAGQTLRLETVEEIAAQVGLGHS